MYRSGVGHSVPCVALHRGVPRQAYQRMGVGAQLTSQWFSVERPPSRHLLWPPLWPAGPRLRRSPSHASFQEVTGNWGPLLDPTLSPCSRCLLFLLPLGVQQCPDSHSPSTQGDGGLWEFWGKCASRRSHVRPQTPLTQQEISRGALRGLS